MVSSVLFNTNNMDVLFPSDHPQRRTLNLKCALISTLFVSKRKRGGTVDRLGATKITAPETVVAKWNKNTCSSTSRASTRSTCCLLATFAKVLTVLPPHFPSSSGVALERSADSEPRNQKRRSRWEVGGTERSLFTNINRAGDS